MSLLFTDCPKNKFKSVLTSCGVLQLSAHHCGIISVPGVVTHCAPVVVVAHLHTTLVLVITSHKSHVSLTAGSCKKIQI